MDESGSPRRQFQKVFGWLVYFFLLVAAFFAAMLACVTITASLTDNTGIEYNDTKFSLYKNIIFEQCANTTPDSVNCTALFWAAAPEVSDPSGNSYTYQPIKGIDSVRKSNPGHPTNGLYDQDGQKTFDWCSPMSCLRDYKIVPAKPYDVAFGYRGYNRLTIWGWMTVSTITGFWFLRNMLEGVRAFGFRISSWRLRTYDYSPFVRKVPLRGETVVETQM